MLDDDKLRFYKGDTARVPLFLYEEDGETPLGANSVSWTIKKPDTTTITEGPLEVTEADFVAKTNDTTAPGLYRIQATFTLLDGSKASAIDTFEVIDPLEVGGASDTADRILDGTWKKISDLFDSDLGGPWLRDKTEDIFNKQKMGLFLEDAIYIINNMYQPQTSYTIASWPQEHIPLVSQALLVEMIYHFIRTYVEQPLVSGAPIMYFDRRDYMARWQSVLQAEEQKLMRMLDLFKTAEAGLGHTAVLIGGYATPWTRMSKVWRTQHPRYFGPWQG